MRILNPFYQPIPGAPSYDQMIEMGWTPPENLEEWGKTVDYNQTIEDIKPFPWMKAREFDEYTKVFSGSILNDLRILGTMGKQ